MTEPQRDDLIQRLEHLEQEVGRYKKTLRRWQVIGGGMLVTLVTVLLIKQEIKLMMELIAILYFVGITCDTIIKIMNVPRRRDFNKLSPAHLEGIRLSVRLEDPEWCKSHFFEPNRHPGLWSIGNLASHYHLSRHGTRELRAWLKAEGLTAPGEPGYVHPRLRTPETPASGMQRPPGAPRGPFPAGTPLHAAWPYIEVGAIIVLVFALLGLAAWLK